VPASAALRSGPVDMASVGMGPARLHATVVAVKETQMSCPCKFLERPKHARVLEAVPEILHMVGMMLLRANSSMAIYFGVITFVGLRAFSFMENCWFHTSLCQAFRLQLSQPKPAMSLH